MEKDVLLVTGASSDMGCALIRSVHGRYGTVLAHYAHSDDRLAPLQAELGEKLRTVKADFSGEEDTLRMIAEIRARGALPTHIVHFPAPRFTLKKFQKTDWPEYEAAFNISFRSLQHVAQAFLPQMAGKKRGRLVVMLSYVTQNAPPKYCAQYVAVKYALLGLVRALAAEYGDRGVTVNGVSPEMVETRFLSEMPAILLEKTAAQRPVGRNLTVSDVIPTIEFLLSEAAGCISGQNIVINSGT